MRIQCDFLYVVVNGKRELYDENGNQVSLDKLLQQFRPREDSGVPVRIIADDGLHDEIPFDLAKARSIVGQKMRAYFCTADGRKVTVYNASAAGEFPVVGLDNAGRPCLWDRKGFPQSGEASMQLYIQIEKEDIEETETAVQEQPEPRVPANEPKEETAVSAEAPAETGVSPIDQFLAEEI